MLTGPIQNRLDELDDTFRKELGEQIEQAEPEQIDEVVKRLTQQYREKQQALWDELLTVMSSTPSKS